MKWVTDLKRNIRVAAKTSLAVFNGRACCLLDLPCCPAPPNADTHDIQVQTVTDKMVEWFNAASFAPSLPETRQYMHVAVSSLLTHVDLVPKGVGAAIVAGYSPWLATIEPARVDTVEGTEKATKDIRGICS